MRPTRSTLIALIILFIISAASLGYLFYTPSDLKFENDLEKIKLEALRGDAKSQMTVGTFLILRDGKIEEGLSWIRKASDQGYPSAQCFLGVTYFEGSFLEKDMDKGVEFYRKSAIQGYQPAQSRLADCYLYGWVVKKDPLEALKWYHLAALQGDTLAMNNIGSMYLHGTGVKEDYTEAFKWFRKAAMCGNCGSQLTLGQMLSVGDGCEKDEVEAYAWLKLSAEEEADAIKELSSLRKKITAEQISQAMKRVNELKPVIHVNCENFVKSIVSEEDSPLTKSVKLSL
ncbi:MAG: tetratricopeptide repeat protein [bacterium]